MKEIIVASGNKGKIKEVQEIFGNEFKVISMKEIGIDIDVEEDKETFRDNAIKKAETIAKELSRRIKENETNSDKAKENNQKWVLADDSGIEVVALDGFPGVRTKRWFPGTDRERNLALIEKLNEKLKETDSKDRRISFVTAIGFFVLWIRMKKKRK